MSIAMGGGVAEDDPTGADLKEDEHVQDTQPNAVDGQEVAGQNSASVSSEELRPGRGPSAAAPGRAGGDTEPGALSSLRLECRA